MIERLFGTESRTESNVKILLDTFVLRNGCFPEIPEQLPPFPPLPYEIGREGKNEGGKESSPIRPRSRR